MGSKSSKNSVWFPCDKNSDNGVWVPCEQRDEALMCSSYRSKTDYYIVEFDLKSGKRYTVYLTWADDAVCNTHVDHMKRLWSEERMKRFNRTCTWNGKYCYETIATEPTFTPIEKNVSTVEPTAPSGYH